MHHLIIHPFFLRKEKTTKMWPMLIISFFLIYIVVNIFHKWINVEM